MYDDNNIFAKILRKEIPCEFIFENEYVAAFNDIEPKAPVHILVIPKGKYSDIDDFTDNASDKEVTEFFRAIGKIAKNHNIDVDGYRIISNCRENGGQEVPHLHVHILGGAKLNSLHDK